MRRITLGVVSTLAALVLLFSYRTSLGDGGSGQGPQALSGARVLAESPAAVPTGSAAGPDPTGSASGSPDPTTPAKAADPASTRTTPPAPKTTASTFARTQTVQGASEMTRYGQVQVQVTIAGGRITDVQALAYPDRERRDQEINAQAIPMLRNQVLAAQSAKVDGVSGATYTTDGYLASVQSALDAVGFRS